MQDIDKFSNTTTTTTTDTNNNNNNIDSNNNNGNTWSSLCYLPLETLTLPCLIQKLI